MLHAALRAADTVSAGPLPAGAAERVAPVRRALAVLEEPAADDPRIDAVLAALARAITTAGHLAAGSS